MKINNWCRNLSATLVAGGLLVMARPAAAAPTGVNLVVNGDFENVNLAITGAYNGPLVLNWTGPNLFAYSHDNSASVAGAVPDYADGADPPGAGHWYFTPNNTGVAVPTDVRTPNTYYQDIDLSTGPTAAAIAGGLAPFSMGAYMSSYLNDADFGTIKADFRNSGGIVLGSASVSDDDVGPDNVWNLRTVGGLIPIGTASVRLSLYGTSFDPNRGGDGYMDNVSFVVGVPEPTSAALAGLGAAAAAGLARRRRGEA